ncbi:MAG: hypothetical protein IPP94_13920 [Ignavibacteria bacterium]|nr:hypothetical protein [Ignavibacteria bacterium]
MHPAFDTSQVRAGDKNRCFVAPVGVQALYRRFVGPMAELFLGVGLEACLLLATQDPNGAGLAQPQESTGNGRSAFRSRSISNLMTENLAFNMRDPARAVHGLPRRFLRGLGR